MRSLVIVAALLLSLSLAPACRRTTSATSDAAKTAPTTPQPFGAPCTSNADCRSNACFTGNSASYCSIVCKQATVATDCPVPPTNGQCNKHGFCKKP